MGEDGDAANKGGRAWGQAVAALVVPVLGLGLWWWGEGEGNYDRRKPPTCADADTAKTPGHVSGRELCEALYRPGLDALLGVPGREVRTVSGGSRSFRPGGTGEAVVTPTAKVEFEGYTVTLDAGYGGLPVGRTAGLMGDTVPGRTVLGRPAALYSDRTLQIRFRLDGSDSSSGPGVPARVLSVAKDGEDQGDSFELSVWRTDGGPLDDAALLRVAEKVLPGRAGVVAGRLRPRPTRPVGVLRFAVADGHLTKNPCRHVQGVSSPGRMRPLS
ncbi:DUF6215 domain-containing protein [Streptomyces lavendulae]|uniref:DUF6215 domain-containing protein n=1 Tax=Streptomyces lavendulae TaxID=1914 RepID=UPI0036E2787B